MTTNGWHTRLGLALPLLQAPMAGAQDAGLALAVGAAGALGALPTATSAPAALRDGLEVLRAAGRPYNLNFFCHPLPIADPARDAAWAELLAPYYREARLEPPPTAAGASRQPFDASLAELVEAFRPPVVSFHFGLPSDDLLSRVKAAGAVVLSSATTVDEARWLERRGVDAVIAQGLEAGGHRGHFLSDDLSRQSGTLALLPQVVAAVRVPVIAAGGIADARGVEAALALGASAVQVGTAFLRCDEATTSPVHRAALAGDLPDVDPAHTALTRLFTGRPARGLVNRLMRECDPMDTTAPAFPLAAARLAPLRAASEAQGRGDFSPLWAGQNTSGCRAGPAAAVVRALAGLDRSPAA
jgi:nitronate monooxygenase